MFLQIFSNHYGLTNTPNEIITNILATVSRIQTDIPMIESEAQQNPSKAQDLPDGLYDFYGIEFGSANDVRLILRLGEMENGYKGMNEVIMDGWMRYWDKQSAVLGVWCLRVTIIRLLCGARLLRSISFRNREKPQID